MRKVICGCWSCSMTLPYSETHCARVQQNKFRIPNGGLTPIKTKWRHKSGSYPCRIHGGSKPRLVGLPRPTCPTNLRVHLEGRVVVLWIGSGGISLRNCSKRRKVEPDSEVIE